MKNNEEYLKSVFDKYEKIQKSNYKNKFYKEQIEIKIKNNLLKTASIILATIISTVGIVYAGMATVEKIWKEPQKYNYFEEQEVTQKDIEQSLTEEEAKKKAIEILEEMGYQNQVIVSAQLYKQPSIDETYWSMKTQDNQLFIDIYAQNRKIKTPF